jgi:hypothetical protein
MRGQRQDCLSLSIKMAQQSQPEMRLKLIHTAIKQRLEKDQTKTVNIKNALK